ncbi:MAG TPA: alpha/beta hydrolase [Candidatus Hydrogenedentes bacterium]|nr:alpha/beta hydrolase [Candidatus Hydrogenedentota bacterium]HPG69242.1 alpha/beta hydrolase [Candidatus Hydrogenedentota bacterium]
MMLVAWVLVSLAKLTGDAHYFDGYLADAPLNVVVRSEQKMESFQRISFTYEGYQGRPVPSLMAIPLNVEPPYPVLVFLHGIGQEKEFLDEVGDSFAKAGFAVATFDQYMQGERRLQGASKAEEGLALWRRGAMTINEARRMVDYLETRPDVDKDRVYLIGASYGAVTGATAAALDRRFRAVVLTYGGGDFTKLAASDEVVRAVGPFIVIVSRVAAWFTSAFDPVRYVARISPRPIYFQNGNRDRIVVPSAALALYDAAKEPKEIKWYPSDHLDLDPEYIPIAIQDAIAWLKARDTEVVAARATTP